MKKKKKKQGARTIHDIENLNPLLTINEPDECLFAIVDFSIPGRNHVRRIISKRTKLTGMVTAVMYEGEVGPDNTCVSKKNIMAMEAAPPEKFWKAINVLRDLYGIVGGISDVRCYDGKTMREAAELMKRFEHAKVWIL
ncbi:MAG: hypothetical protein ABIH66_04585 [bacterium]